VFAWLKLERIQTKVETSHFLDKMPLPLTYTLREVSINDESTNVVIKGSATALFNSNETTSPPKALPEGFPVFSSGAIRFHLQYDQNPIIQQYLTAYLAWCLDKVRVTSPSNAIDADSKNFVE
jgi:hypothetical protein